jgi:hypothetical protein
VYSPRRVILVIRTLRRTSRAPILAPQILSSDIPARGHIRDPVGAPSIPVSRTDGANIANANQESAGRSAGSTVNAFPNPASRLRRHRRCWRGRSNADSGYTAGDRALVEHSDRAERAGADGPAGLSARRA